jgi:hypothetical protein
MYSGPCTVEISVPNDSSASQFHFNGQTISIQLPNVLSTPKEIKEILSNSHLNQIGVGKLQLKHGIHGFLKDTNSLASLNLGNGTQLELSLKSRGGKR